MFTLFLPSLPFSWCRLVPLSDAETCFSPIRFLFRFWTPSFSFPGDTSSVIGSDMTRYYPLANDVPEAFLQNFCCQKSPRLFRNFLETFRASNCPSGLDFFHIPLLGVCPTLKNCFSDSSPSHVGPHKGLRCGLGRG